jgi:AcrR family transcriptional regulator
MTFAAPFHRARSDEQRAERRQAILDAAADILSESRVSELSLTALAHRVGLAKSNVLRYFDSREAVLLELYDREFRAWLADLRARTFAPRCDGRPAWKVALKPPEADSPETASTVMLSPRS